jgi:hypothetical protein
VVNVDRNAVSDVDFVHTGTAADHRAGPFVTRRERSEGRLSGEGFGLDRDIGTARPTHRHPNQHLIARWAWHGLGHHAQVIGPEEDSGAHDVGDLDVGCPHAASWRIHDVFTSLGISLS